MSFINHHLLSLLIFLPLIGIIFILLIPGQFGKVCFKVAFLVSLLELALSIYLYCQPMGGMGFFEYTEMYPWIPVWNINYHLGIDGVSLLLITLTNLLMPIIFLGSWNSIQTKPKEFVISMLFLQVGMVGVFCALDLFLFYVFWEVMLVPMYFIIGIWGGKRKIYASIKFFIYTMAGSVLMLIAILFVYFKTGNTFDLVTLYEKASFSPQEQIWLFAAFALAFAIKVPLFPLHTWLPDAHVEAPTAGSVILAGVLLKMGTYGFFRFAMPLFPQGFIHFQPYLIALCVIGIIYGALVAMVQPDIKKLIAYSSVSHLGVVMLGLFSLEPTAVSGGLYQMINHGISTGALFLLVGMIYDRTHSRQIADHGGLAAQMPIYGVIFIIVTLSSIGLPLTNGFVGEFLTLAGAFQKFQWATILSSTGVVLSAVYMLWMVERVFFGQNKNPTSHALVDLNVREILLLVPLLILIVWMGVAPHSFLSKMDGAITQMVSRVVGQGPIL